jgi:putative transposase
MIDRSHQLPIKRQAELLAISRGSVYYHPEPVNEADLNRTGFRGGLLA